MLHNADVGKPARDFKGSIAACAIDKNHFICPANLGEAVANDILDVFNRQENRNHSCHGLPRLSCRGLGYRLVVTIMAASRSSETLGRQPNAFMRAGFDTSF